MIIHPKNHSSYHLLHHHQLLHHSPPSLLDPSNHPVAPSQPSTQSSVPLLSPISSSVSPSSPMSYITSTLTNESSFSWLYGSDLQLTDYGDISQGYLISDTVYVNDTLTPVLRNSSDVLNVSQDLPLHWAMLLFGYIMPLLFITTLIANSLVIIVLSQKHMRTPTNIVLHAMAISDLLTMMFPAPWYFYVYTLGYHSKLLHPVTACYLFYCMMEVLPALFHTASIWLTLLLALQRYIYVCHPITARTWCTGECECCDDWIIGEAMIEFSPTAVLTWTYMAWLMDE